MPGSTSISWWWTIEAISALTEGEQLAVTDAPVLEATEGRASRIGELIDRVRSGELEAFNDLIRLHERRIFGMAVQMGLSPEDAQDAGQEVFLRVFRYLSGFQSGKNFEVWLWKIAVNVVYDALRKRRSRGEVSWETLVEQTGEPPARLGSLQISIENADLCARVLERMSVLSKQERMVFVLRDMQDLDTAEVARAMGISTITVRRHGASARQKLRDQLEGIAAGRR
jgi:RNA polymerase sigma-70 factor (ECF subfamily)